MSEGGITVEGAWDSGEDAGWCGLARPLTWRLEVAGPALGDAKTFVVGASQLLTPPPPLAHRRCLLVLSRGRCRLSGRLQTSVRQQWRLPQV